jgi:hypothetical protein
VKIPIEAVAAGLIAVVALYVFRAVEPKMNPLQAPSTPEQVFLEDEPSKPTARLRTGSPALEEKTDAKAAVNAAQKRDRAPVENERAKGSVLEEKQEVRPARKAPVSPKASEPGPAEAPRSPVVAMKKEPPAGLAEEPKRAFDSAKEQEMPPQSYLPVPEARQKAMGEKEFVGAGAPKGRTLAAAPKLEVTRREKTTPVTFTVRASDVKMAGDETESLLHKLGLEKIERESVEDREVFTADLQAEKAKDLLDNLRRIGEVRVEGAPADKVEGVTGIRIEISSNP